MINENLKYKTKDKACSVFGHSKIEITEDLIKKLKEVFTDLIENKDVGLFYFGGFGMFDTLCHQIVTELKQKYSFIKRLYCVQNERLLRASKRPKYLRDEDYEDFVYLTPDFDWWYTIIYYRNCEIIKYSDYVVFYLRNNDAKSGAYKAYKFAVKNKSNIINV